MADRIEVLLLGVGSALISAALIYGLARGEITGWGYAATASFTTFMAVTFAVRLALLGRGLLLGDSKGGEKR